MAAKLERLIGVLNGLVGDHLARSGNELATTMGFVHGGAALSLDAALARAHADPRPRVVVLVHGLMDTERVWTGGPADADSAGRIDYGAELARDRDSTSLYLRYNTGRPIADNGAALSSLLEALVDAYPVPITELWLLGHSMGGLVIRSACHAASVAGHRWLDLVRRAIYVGTPHQGAPLERVGRIVSRVLHTVDDPYTRLVARIADLRSDGLKDLGDADLRHEDRARRAAQLGLRDPSHPVPLLPSIEHYLVAGTVAVTPWLTSLFGDSIVPLASATNGEVSARSPLPPDHVAVFPGISHFGLAHHPEVYARILAWCTP